MKIAKKTERTRNQKTLPPVLMFSSGIDNLYNFFDPSSSKIPHQEEIPAELLAAAVIFSKDGWLILSLPRKMKLIFLNLFTKETFYLSRMDFVNTNPYFCTIGSIGIDDGCCDYGKVEIWVVYDHHKDARNVLPNPESVSIDRPCYLTKSDQGELLSMFTGIYEKLVEDLGKKTLFISHGSSLSTLTGVKEMENKIYFARFQCAGRSRTEAYDYEPLVYCMETAEISFYGAKAYANSIWVERDGCRDGVKENASSAIQSGEKTGVQLFFPMKKRVRIRGVGGK
ncbi:hypothetical protein ACLOJK_009004 [Asimina triloba]